MNFMKWLRWVGSAASPDRKTSSQPSSGPNGETGASGIADAYGTSPTNENVPIAPAETIDLASREVLAEALNCARHALVMEYREIRKSNPTQSELAEWSKPLWEDRDQARSIIQKHNAMALSLGERFQDFWPELQKAAITPSGTAE